MAKIGRNDPCPCGSGKKYKKCCLNKKQNHSDEFIYQQSRQIDNKIIDKLSKYSINKFGSEVLHRAWQDFSGQTRARFSDNNPHAQLFLPWFFFNWFPGSNKEFKIPLKKSRYTITDFYLEKYSDHISSLERIYIEQINKQPFSYYEVTHVEAGLGMNLRNMLWNENIFVMEKSGTENLKTGSFLFCRIIDFEGINLMVGSSTISIPRNNKITLLNLKDVILKQDNPITKENIQNWQNWLIESYLDLFDRIMSPPKMINKDGDELVFCELRYKIKDAWEIWKCLQELTDITDEEFQELADVDEKGKLQHFEFPWLSPLLPKETNPSIFANITLSPKKLTVSVNSKAREQKAKATLKKLLGSKAEFQTSVMRNLDSMLNDADLDTFADDMEMSDDDTEQIMNDIPEMQEMVEQHFEKHWQNWIDKKIAALGNITPREAVKTKRGKEKVLTLLEDAEYSSR